jgi:hypothetical protein
MCTRSGVVPSSKQEFLKWVWPRNLQNLSIWQTIGHDVENGFWAIHGARCGTYYLMLEQNWNHTEVRDFNKLDELWELHKNDQESDSIKIAQELNKHLGTNIIEFDEQQSKFFKDYISKNWNNMGPMITELSVIRSQEGW